MIQMGVRWYDPQIGRWISADTIVPDPANPQSFNRFSYVLGNPLKYVDPTGYFEEEVLIEQYGREQVNEWKQDEAWWNLLLEAEFDDIVSAHFGQFVATFIHHPDNANFVYLNTKDGLTDLTEWEGAPFRGDTYAKIGGMHAGSLKLQYELARWHLGTEQEQAKLEVFEFRRITTLHWADAPVHRVQVWHRVGRVGWQYFTWEKLLAGSGVPLLASTAVSRIPMANPLWEINPMLKVAVWWVYLENLFHGVELESHLTFYSPPAVHFPEGH